MFSGFLQPDRHVTEPKSQLKVDYKPSGEAYVHDVPAAPRVRYRFWLLLALSTAGAAAFQFFGTFAAGSGYGIRGAVLTPASGASLAARSAVAPGMVATPAPASHADTSAAAPLAPGAAAPHTKIVRLTVRRGDSLAKLFARNALSAADLHAILALGGDAAHLQHIRPGESITVAHADNGRILSLQMQLDDVHRLDVEQGSSGFRAGVTGIPVETSVAYAHAVIKHTLFDAATGAGVPDSVTMQLIHLFGWDIDFARDIRNGDSFAVLYQNIHRQGQPVTDGPILAAEFTARGRTYRIVRFTDPSGHTDYYTPDGRSLRKMLLRAPLNYTRISSGFSLHRMNPVLHIIRPHYGVDYAAPTGTPIKAAGDGRIVFLGREEGYGRCVIIKHGGGYSTLYAHMSHFRRDLHAGSRVTQDEVIGYVGMSGEATGPHLHFEIRVDGIPRNPRTVQLPSAHPVLARYRPEFDHTLGTLLAELNNGGEVRVAGNGGSGTGTGIVTTAH